MMLLCTFYTVSAVQTTSQLAGLSNLLNTSLSPSGTLLQLLRRPSRLATPSSR